MDIPREIRAGEKAEDIYVLLPYTISLAICMDSLLLVHIHRQKDYSGFRHTGLTRESILTAIRHYLPTDISKEFLPTSLSPRSTSNYPKRM